MGHKISHIEKLRDAVRRGIEHLKAALDSGKAALDCGGEVLITLLEDHQANAETSSGKTESGPAQIKIGKRELTAQELADIWQVTYRAVIKWKDEQGLPYKKVGRLLRFDWLEADAWSKRNRESFNKARLRVVRLGRSVAAAPNRSE